MHRSTTDLAFFDANCMVGKWLKLPLQFERPEELASWMAYFGIAETLAFHSGAVRDNEPMAWNTLLAEALLPFPHVHPCWVLLPGDAAPVRPVTALADSMKKAGVKGIRLFPRNHFFSLREWNAGTLLSFLEEAGLPVFIDLDQFGDERSRIDLTHAYECCRHHPRLNLIITNTSIYAARMFYALFEQCPRFHIEISTYFIFNGIRDIARRFGAGRLIYGSRMPFQPAGSSLAAVTCAPVPEEEKAAIAAGNIRRLLAEIRL